MQARGRSRWVAGTAILSLGALVCLAAPRASADPAGRWELAGGPETGFGGQPTVLLGTGEVLFFEDGGQPHLYAPEHRTITAVPGYEGGRPGHSATLLHDGRVLVAGGEGPDLGGDCCISVTGSTASSLYEPLTRGWAATGSMSTGSFEHTATVLLDGRVLKVGGGISHDEEAVATTDEAELYDPGTGAWTPAASVPGPRRGHTATRLDDGRVLVVGGIALDLSGGSVLADPPAAVFDPATATWSPVAATPRTGHTATLLASGNVLIAGGATCVGLFGTCVTLSSSELFDPETGMFEPAAGMVEAREPHAAALLPSGHVLATGGGPRDSLEVRVERTTELYDPATNVWVPGPSMGFPHLAHSATALTDGRVLVAGGSFAVPAEVFVPVIPVMPAPVEASRFVPLAPARILDTRIGLGAALAPVGDDAQIDLEVAGRAGVPADAVAVALNLTATNATGPGYVTAWPAGELRPIVSTLNLEHAGQTIPNAAIVRLGAGGRISLYAQTSTDLVADISGYWLPSGMASEGRFVPLNPMRVLDTRDGNGAPRQPVGDNSTLHVQITGRGGLPSEGIGAVALNVTATGTTGPGFVTVWPGGPRPEVSTLNVEAAGQTIPNFAIAPWALTGASPCTRRPRWISSPMSRATSPTSPPGQALRGCSSHSRRRGCSTLGNDRSAVASTPRRNWSAATAPTSSSPATARYPEATSERLSPT